MSKACFLGIDTSNYTTSLAFCDESGNIVANLKRPLPVNEGERGLRQSDAVFLHTKNIPELFEEARAYFNVYRPVAIGVSAYPRTVEGSYMPCFLAGKASAYALGAAIGIPVSEFSHQNGHIMAAAYSGGALPLAMEDPFLVFHVSGGTTEVILAKYEEKDFSCQLIGGTLDINAGQAIDRVGVMLGFDFPCGKQIEKSALQYDGKVNVKPTLKEENCCLSGLENLCKNMYDKGESPEKISYFCLKYIEATLCKMTEKLIDKYGKLPLLFAGGVMSNSIIRQTIENKYGAIFALPEFSSDNACGVAYLAYRKYIEGK